MFKYTIKKQKRLFDQDELTPSEIWFNKLSFYHRMKCTVKANWGIFIFKISQWYIKKISL